MDTAHVDAKAGSDRFSTCDEIRAALSSLPDFTLAPSDDSVWEVESDYGGRVLIETENVEMLSMLGKLDTSLN